MSAGGNRPLGVWFPAVFVVVGVSVLVAGIAVLVTGTVGVALFLLLFGVVFAGAGAGILVSMLRSHRQAVPTEVTVRALTAAGWEDVTGRTRQRLSDLPGPVLAHLRLRGDGPGGGPMGFDPTVADLAGIDPSGLQAAGLRATARAPTGVAESWAVTSVHRTNDEITGGTLEPRVVAWQQLPADIGSVTIRPDNVRMRLADLTGIATDHTVGWEAVDDTWHLYGDDEPLLRAVVDIGLMGRLTELPGRWIVQFRDGYLLVVPTSDRNQLTARPPTLTSVAGDIGDVVVAVRSILPEMLWSGLDEFLAAYRR